MIDLLSAPREGGKKHDTINISKIRVLWKAFVFANAKVTIQNILINKFWNASMAVTNQNCIHEEVKSTLNLQTACYHSLLFKNIKIKIHKTVTLPRVLTHAKLHLSC
jgi:hypothetical protein